MRKKTPHPLIIGTLILTITGFVSRIIGFFYRIYLSRLFGEEGMGIYQLLSPVLALSFALTAGAYQTTISKMVAEKAACRDKEVLHPMFTGLTLSLPLSLLTTSVVYLCADPIGTLLLKEPRTVPMLRILAFSFPFSAIHACINGYFYGVKKAGIPAFAQIVEQLVRVFCVYGFSMSALAKGQTPNINIAVLGLAIGELFSMLVALFALFPVYAARKAPSTDTKSFLSRASYQGLLHMAIPLTANRIVLNLLQSVESVSIPNMLRQYGYDTVTSLSVYGVLTGMAMPLIFFPNAITGSISVLLLPMISESYCLGDIQSVKKYTLRTVKYCFLLGIACLTVLFLSGNFLGRLLFDSPLAGHFITTLSFLCPFIYLDTTLSSILQGLGMAKQIFITNTVCLLLRLAFVFLAVPRVGIMGYLWGILASQIVLCVLYLFCYRSCVHKKKS